LAKLSTGIDVGGGQWLLPPTKLNSLTVTTAPNVAGKFNIEAELLKDDAQTAIFGPVVFTLHIGNTGSTGEAAPTAPAGKLKAAGAAPQPDPITSTASAGNRGAQVASLGESGQVETDFLTQMLIRDGNKLMRDGDIIAARRLYEQAAANGNPEAALAMGRSYDPSYFEKLPVKTGKPDPATAFEWYKRALDGGLVTARVKIDGLKQWLQR
jgi:TPR repeat protein